MEPPGDDPRCAGGAQDWWSLTEEAKVVGFLLAGGSTGWKCCAWLPSGEGRTGIFWTLLGPVARLLDWMRFWKQILFSRVKIFREKDSVFPLDSFLIFSSNSGEKSYLDVWLDFDQQRFAERESILKRQFCVIEQYSVNKRTLVIVFSNTQSLFWNWTSELLFVAEIIFRF